MLGWVLGGRPRLMVDQRSKALVRSVPASGWAPFARLSAGPFGRVAEHLDDVSGQAVLDLPVARDRLGNPGGWVAIPIVLASMPRELTAECFNGTNQVNALH